MNPVDPSSIRAVGCVRNSSDTGTDDDSEDLVSSLKRRKTQGILAHNFANQTLSQSPTREQLAQHEFMLQGVGITNTTNKNNGGVMTGNAPQHPSQIGSIGMLMMGPPPPLGSLSASGISVAPRGSVGQEQQRGVGQNFVNLQQQLAALQNQANISGGERGGGGTVGRASNMSGNADDRIKGFDAIFSPTVDEDGLFGSGGLLPQQQLLSLQAQQLLQQATAASSATAQPSFNMITSPYHFQPNFFPSHDLGSNNISNNGPTGSFFSHGNTVINPNAFGPTSLQDEMAFNFLDNGRGVSTTNFEPDAFPDIPGGSKDTSDIALSGRQPRTLYMPCDDESLSEYQCLVRQQIEIFEAGLAEVESNAKGRNKPIVLGQVGIRCRHCSKVAPKQRTKGAMYYPAKLNGLYQAAQSLASGHLCTHCQHIPAGIRQELIVLKEKKSSAGGGKDYWGDGVRILGVFEDEDGLRFRGGKP